MRLHRKQLLESSTHVQRMVVKHPSSLQPLFTPFMSTSDVGSHRATADYEMVITLVLEFLLRRGSADSSIQNINGFEGVSRVSRSTVSSLKCETRLCMTIKQRLMNTQREV